MAKTTLKINGMSCDHCVKSVTDVLMGANGVSKAKVNLKKGEARINFNNSEVTPAKLGEAIAEAGYELVSVK